MINNKKFTLILFIFWTVAATFFAYYRSFWCDEIVRLSQSYMSLAGGIKTLLNEPSPFSPGENILNYLSRVVFSAWLPEELWARLPGILWGLGTLFIACRFAHNPKFQLAPLLLVFSVSFLMISVQMRPYASLIFAGAVATLVLLERDKRNPVIFWFSWIALILTHIYGICFVAFACFLRCLWTQALFGFLFVAAILYNYGHHAEKGRTAPPSLMALARELLGALGNPHKVSILFLIFFIIGLWHLWQKERIFFYSLGILVAVCVICPLVPTILSGYFFAPRQSIGGLLPFLMICSVGIQTMSLKIQKQKLAAVLTALAISVMAVIPWGASLLLKKPPFPDQPQHKFTEIVHKIILEGRHNILVANTCYRPSVNHYFQKEFNQQQPTSEEAFTVSTLRLSKTCWGPNAEVCVSTPTDINYCFVNLEGDILPEPLPDIIRSTQPPFDFLIYDPKGFSSGSVEAARAW